MLDSAFFEGRHQVVFGKIVELEARVASKAMIIPIVGDQPSRQLGNGLGQHDQHVGPNCGAQIMVRREIVKLIHVVGKVGSETFTLDDGLAGRMATEMERLIQSHMDLARRA